MVCCALFATLLASVFWLVRRVVPAFGSGGQQPLEWRLEIPHPTMPALAPFSMKLRLKSVAYAVNGLNGMLRNEHNAWVHLAATLIVIVAGVTLQISFSDWRWIFAAICLVWIAEAVNTAIEHVCDVVSLEINQGIKAAKDVAAGAVLISAILAVLIGTLTLWPYFAERFGSDNPAFEICRQSV
ncbi:MAG: diacylglycerol kinase family protein [Stappiaceae bacterium]